MNLHDIHDHSLDIVLAYMQSYYQFLHSRLNPDGSVTYQFGGVGYEETMLPRDVLAYTNRAREWDRAGRPDRTHA